MNLTDEQKMEITEISSLPGLTTEDIAIIVGIEPAVFIAQVETKGSDIYMAYHKGLLMIKAQLGKKIKTLSEQGSGPAQTLMVSMMRKQEYQKLLLAQSHERTED